MRKYIITLLSVALCLQGCKTSEKFKLYSSEDATVYLPSDPGVSCASIKNGGYADIQVPSDAYIGYVTLYDENTGLAVPYGLDVHNRNPIGTKATIGVAYVLAGVGLAATFAGLIGLAVDSESSFGSTAAIIGLPAAGAGAAIGLPMQNRTDQMSYDYQFAYDKKQMVNISGLSSVILREDQPKTAQEDTNVSKRKKAKSGEKDTVKSTSSKSTKTRNNLSNAVAGTYVGIGRLENDKDTEEEYTDIEIIIEVIDKNHVDVVVLEDGEEFFETPMRYEIVKNGKNGYKLTMQNLPDATITISKNGKLSYLHKKVNIDDELFLLSLECNKKSKK